ncbi:hypothetical protein DIPPA_14933 [Diplonema papillatum]|nr:hypothetical protein DIPPA_14933 [Diplonema papillatum]
MKRIKRLLAAAEEAKADDDTRFLEGDSLQYACDASQRGQLVWTAVSDRFLRVMDCASHTVCFELVCIDDLDCVFESTTTPSLGFKRKGRGNDLIITVTDPARRELLTAHICKAFTAAAARKRSVAAEGRRRVLPLVSLEEDFMTYLCLPAANGVDDAQKKPATAPLPFTENDTLHLAKNASVKSKLAQYGDQTVELTDRVQEVTTGAPPSSKVLILSDAAIYLTDKVGKVEYRASLDTLSHVEYPAADPTLITLQFSCGRPPSTFRTRMAPALLAAVAELSPHTRVGSGSAGESSAPAAGSLLGSSAGGVVPRVDRLSDAGETRLHAALLAARPEHHSQAAPPAADPPAKQPILSPPTPGAGAAARADDRVPAPPAHWPGIGTQPGTETAAKPPILSPRVEGPDTVGTAMSARSLPGQRGGLGEAAAKASFLSPRVGGGKESPVLPTPVSDAAGGRAATVSRSSPEPKACPNTSTPPPPMARQLFSDAGDSTAQSKCLATHPDLTAPATVTPREPLAQAAAPKPFASFLTRAPLLPGDELTGRKLDALSYQAEGDALFKRDARERDTTAGLYDAKVQDPNRDPHALKERDSPAASHGAVLSYGRGSTETECKQESRDRDADFKARKDIGNSPGSAASSSASRTRLKIESIAFLHEQQVLQHNNRMKQASHAPPSLSPRGPDSGAATAAPTPPRAASNPPMVQPNTSLGRALSCPGARASGSAAFGADPASSPIAAPVEGRRRAGSTGVSVGTGGMVASDVCLGTAGPQGAAARRHSFPAEAWPYSPFSGSKPDFGRAAGASTRADAAAAGGGSSRGSSAGGKSVTQAQLDIAEEVAHQKSVLERVQEQQQQLLEQAARAFAEGCAPDAIEPDHRGTRAQPSPNLFGAGWSNAPHPRDAYELSPDGSAQERRAERESSSGGGRNDRARDAYELSPDREASGRGVGGERGCGEDGDKVVRASGREGEGGAFQLSPDGEADGKKAGRSCSAAELSPDTATVLRKLTEAEVDLNLYQREVQNRGGYFSSSRLDPQQPHPAQQQQHKQQQQAVSLTVSPACPGDRRRGLTSPAPSPRQRLFYTNGPSATSDQQPSHHATRPHHNAADDLAPLYSNAPGSRETTSPMVRFGGRGNVNTPPTGLVGPVEMDTERKEAGAPSSRCKPGHVLFAGTDRDDTDAASALESEAADLRRKLRESEEQMEEASARLRAYVEANEALRQALEAAGVRGEEQRDERKEDSCERTAEDRIKHLADEVEELKLLVSFRDAELQDLQKQLPTHPDPHPPGSCTFGTPTASDRSNHATRSRTAAALPSHKTKPLPSKLEQHLAAKTRTCAAGADYIKALEAKIARNEAKDLETKVQMLEQVIFSAKEDAKKAGASGDAAVNGRIAANHEVVHLRQKVQGLEADCARLDAERRTVTATVVEKAKRKAEDLASDASTARLHLAEAVATVEALQARLQKSEIDAARTLMDKEKEYMATESDLRKTYETRLAKVEERTQAYERKLARNQAQILEQLHAREMQLGQVERERDRMYDGTSHGTEHQEMDRLRATNDALQTQLQVVDSELESLRQEHKRSAVIGSPRTAMNTDDSALKMLQKIGELEDRVASRDALVARLKGELSRLTPMLASSQPALARTASAPNNATPQRSQAAMAPGFALSKLKDQEQSLLAMTEANRMLQTKIDALEGELHAGQRQMALAMEATEVAQRQHNAAIDKMQEELSGYRQKAIDSAAKLEAKVKAAEAGAYLSLAVSPAARGSKRDRNDLSASPFRKTNGSAPGVAFKAAEESLREEVFKLKAQLLKQQEASDKELGQLKGAAKHSRAQGKQISQLKHELDSIRQKLAAAEALSVQAESDAKMLKEDNAAACANLRDAEEAVHHWQRQVEQLEAENEQLLHSAGSEEIATRDARVADLERQLRRATEQFKELDEHMVFERKGWEQRESQLEQLLAAKARELQAAEIGQQETVRRAIDNAIEELRDRGHLGASASSRRDSLFAVGARSDSPRSSRHHTPSESGGGSGHNANSANNNNNNNHNSNNNNPNPNNGNSNPNHNSGNNNNPNRNNGSDNFHNHNHAHNTQQNSNDNKNYYNPGSYQTPRDCNDTSTASSSEPSGEDHPFTQSSDTSPFAQDTHNRDCTPTATDRIAKVKASLQRNGLVETDKLNRCVERLYSALQPPKQAKSKQAPAATAAEQCSAAGYARRHQRSLSRVKPNGSKPMPPVEPGRYFPVSRTLGERDGSAEPDCVHIAPMAVSDRKEQSAPALSRLRSTETAALYDKLGLKDLAPFAAT